MNDKKNKLSFTIRFNRCEPSHLQVAEILNQQKRFCKAQYIVDAVLHYVGCGLNKSAAQPAQFDEKYIEAIVNRILCDRDRNSGSLTTSAGQVETSPHSHAQDNKKEFRDATEIIGREGVKAVTDALVSFRKK